VHQPRKPRRAGALEADGHLVVEVPGPVSADEREEQREECQRASNETPSPAASTRSRALLSHLVIPSLAEPRSHLPARAWRDRQPVPS
jgi:hypothetical protein